MKRYFLAAALAASPAQASDKDWQAASDIGVYSLMALSIGLPAVEGDEHGAFQAAGSLAVTTALTELGKEAFPKLRPDGSDRRSFPSGHTSRAFAAAATLYNRQGNDIGIPAFAVAALVGLARVEGRKHDVEDVLAGGALGAVTGFLITRKQPVSRSALVPWGDSKRGGISFAMRF